MDNISDDKIINDNATNNGSNNNTVISRRLEAVRGIMKEKGVDIYVVVTGDYHISEYAGDYFKEREFISGFSGSAGTAVITSDTAVLFTDGRYFVQAEKQLEGSTVTLYRMAEEGVPAVEEFVKDKLPQGGCIGFDGRTVNGAWGEKFVAIAEEKKGSLFVGEDLINLIWTDRPELSKEHCREDQRCACKDGRGRCRCPHSYEPLRYCMAFEYPWR